MATGITMGGRGHQLGRGDAWDVGRERAAVDGRADRWRRALDLKRAGGWSGGEGKR